MSNTVIDRINALCRTYGWSYYRLAKESGLTYSTLNSALKNGTTPSVYTLDKICGGFKISLSQFFAEDEVLAALSPEQKEHLKNWDKLSEENKAFVEKFIFFLVEQQNSVSEK